MEPLAVAADGAGARRSGNGRKHSRTSSISGTSRCSPKEPVRWRGNTEKASAPWRRISCTTAWTAPGARSMSASQNTRMSPTAWSVELAQRPRLTRPPGRSWSTGQDPRLRVGSGFPYEDPVRTVGRAVVEEQDLLDVLVEQSRQCPGQSVGLIPNRHQEGYPRSVVAPSFSGMENRELDQVDGKVGQLERQEAEHDPVEGGHRCRDGVQREIRSSQLCRPGTASRKSASGSRGSDCWSSASSCSSRAVNTSVKVAVGGTGVRST